LHSCGTITTQTLVVLKEEKEKKNLCGDWGDDPGVSSNVVTHIFSLFPEVKGIEGCIYHSF
jgi:hypothetical protein